MTLVELIAATTIAALLSVALIGVLRGLKQQQPSSLDDTTEIPWKLRLADRLRADLLNGRQYAWNQDELLIIGYGSTNTATSGATFQPARIRYRIETIGGRSFLTRTAELFQSRSNRKVPPEILCSGIERIIVGALQEDPVDLIDGPTSASLSPLPHRLQCLLLDANDHVLVNCPVTNPGANR